MIDPTTINPSTLPFVPLDERHTLPTHGAIYVVFGRDDLVLYIPGGAP